MIATEMEILSLPLDSIIVIEITLEISRNMMNHFQCFCSDVNVGKYETSFAMVFDYMGRNSF